MKKNVIIFIMFSTICFSAQLNGKIEKTRENDSGQKRDIEIEYNEKGQIVQEIHRNILGEVTAKYVFKNYDDKNGKPVSGVILDGNEKEKATVELHYNKKNEIVLMIQKDEVGDIISVSQFFKDNDGVFEEVTNDKAELYKLLKHYENKSINLLSETGKKEFEKMKKDNEKEVEAQKESNQSKDMITSIETLKTKEEIDEVGDAVTITRVDLLSDNTTKKDTLLAELFTDGIKSRTKAEIVMLNGGAFKASIKSGKIYKEDIKRVLAEDKIYLVYLTGKEIESILKKESAFESGSNWYLNSAGITFDKVGKEVKNIRINGMPIDIYAKYRTAVNEYILSGKEIYSEVTKRETENVKESGTDMVAKYMRMIKIIDGSYILEIRNNVTE